MRSTIRTLIEPLTLVRNPRASDERIEALQQALGLRLPADYVEFLRIADGAEGFLSTHAYLQLYSIEQVIESHKPYTELVPWLLLFGSSGSMGGYTFDTRSQPMPIVEVDWIGLDLNPMYSRGATFVEFLENLAKGVDPIEIDPEGSWDAGHFDGLPEP